MNNISVFFAEPADCSLCPVAMVGAFLDTEAHGLCEILEALGDDEALDMVLELISMDRADPTDRRELIAMINLVLEALESVPFLVVMQAEMAGHGPRELQSGIRWYGARLAELVYRLRF